MSGYKVSCKVASKDGTGGCKFNVTTPAGNPSKLKSKTAIVKAGIKSKAELDAMERRARERAIRAGVTKGRKQVIGKLWTDRDCSADDYNIDCVLKPDGKCQLYCNKKKTTLKKILDMAGDDKKKRAGLRRAVRAATDNATKEAVYKGSYILRGSKPAKKTQHKGFASLNPFFKFSQAMHELGAVEHIGSGRSKASERSKYLASIYKNVPSLKDSLEKANTIEKAKKIIQSGVQMGKLPKAAPLQQQLPKPSFVAPSKSVPAAPQKVKKTLPTIPKPSFVKGGKQAGPQKSLLGSQRQAKVAPSPIFKAPPAEPPKKKKPVKPLEKISLDENEWDLEWISQACPPKINNWDQDSLNMVLNTAKQIYRDIKSQRSQFIDWFLRGTSNEMLNKAEIQKLQKSVLQMVALIRLACDYIEGEWDGSDESGRTHPPLKDIFKAQSIFNVLAFKTRLYYLTEDFANRAIASLSPSLDTADQQLLLTAANPTSKPDIDVLIPMADSTHLYNVGLKIFKSELYKFEWDHTIDDWLKN